MSLTPEQRIAVTTLIRTMMDEFTIPEVNPPAINESFIENQVKQHLQAIGAKEAAQILRDEMEKISTQVEVQIKATKEYMEQIHKKTSPTNIILSLDQTHKKLADVQNQVKEMQINFDRNFTSRYIEIVSDEDLVSLYKQSGLVLKNIADHFNVELTTAHRYANGLVTKIDTRDQLKKLFVKAIERKMAI